MRTLRTLTFTRRPRCAPPTAAPQVAAHLTALGQGAQARLALRTLAGRSRSLPVATRTLLKSSGTNRGWARRYPSLPLGPCFEHRRSLPVVVRALLKSSGTNVLCEKRADRIH